MGLRACLFIYSGRSLVWLKASALEAEDRKFESSCPDYKDITGA